MTSRRILCYGDSNTYGYDPRDWFGGRYDAGHRWVDLLNSWGPNHFMNAGENGRELPHSIWALKELDQLIERSQPDLLMIMLGTNDLLNGVSLQEVLKRMISLISHVKECFPKQEILILSPAAATFWDPEDPAYNLALPYEKIATELNTGFLDAGLWGLPMAHDGVHLTQQAHVIFAEKLKEYFA